MMSHTYVNFIWSINSKHSWIIKNEDILANKFTYFYGGQPIYSIIEPMIINGEYITSILLSGYSTKESKAAHNNGDLIDAEWVQVAVKDIYDLSDQRNNKLNSIIK